MTTFAPLLDPDDEVQALRRAAGGAGLGPRPAAPADSGTPVTRTTYRGTSDETTSDGKPPDRAEPPEPLPSSSPPLSRSAVVEWLRETYAAALEYPPDVVTESARLEAELGVDSLSACF